MHRQTRLIATTALAMTAQLAAGLALAAGEGGSSSKKDRPSKVEAIEGSKVKRVTVTEKAAKRLDIQTAEVGREGADQLSAPYASILYDISGGTWVYTMPQALTFVRQSVVVYSIKGGKVVLKEGPAPGTKIVTVGVAELYGAEKGVGH
jgi:hypothetical protein